MTSHKQTKTYLKAEFFDIVNSNLLHGIAATCCSQLYFCGLWGNHDKSRIGEFMYNTKYGVLRKYSNVNK